MNENEIQKMRESFDNIESDNLFVKSWLKRRLNPKEVEEYLDISVCESH